MDVRDLDGDLVVSHDPPRQGALPLQAVLDLRAGLSPHAPLAVNVKADGLHAQLAAALADPPWFAFDMSIPDTLAALRQGVPVFTRHSDVEPEPLLYDQAVGVWLDDFAGGFITEQRIAEHVANGKRVAVVSPELHRRDHRTAWREWASWAIWDEPRVALCTDHPTAAETAFGLDGGALAA